MIFSFVFESETECLRAYESKDDMRHDWATIELPPKLGKKTEESVLLPSL